MHAPQFRSAGRLDIYRAFSGVNQWMRVGSGPLVSGDQASIVREPLFGNDSQTLITHSESGLEANEYVLILTSGRRA